MNHAELAGLWWANRRDGGVYDLENRLSEREVDDAFAIDGEVDRLVLDEATFGSMLLELVTQARDEDEKAFVGTQILEDGDRGLGPRAMDIFDQLVIDPQTRAQVLSGFWPAPPFPHTTLD